MEPLKPSLEAYSRHLVRTYVAVIRKKVISSLASCCLTNKPSNQAASQPHSLGVKPVELYILLAEEKRKKGFGLYQNVSKPIQLSSKSSQENVLRFYLVGAAVALLLLYLLRPCWLLLLSLSLSLVTSKPVVLKKKSCFSFLLAYTLAIRL